MPVIAEGLKSKDATVRENAAKTLVDLGPDARAAIPALAEAIQDENLSVGLKAAEALGKIGKPAIPALTKALQSKNDAIRRLAAEGLSAAGPNAKGAVPILAELLRDKSCSTETKQSVVAALAKIGPAAQPATSALIAAIQEPKQDDAIRRNASAALVHIGEPAVAELAKAFRDPNASFYIRDSLRRIGKPAVAAVADVLTDKTRSVRERSAALLGDIGAGAQSALPGADGGGQGSRSRRQQSGPFGDEENSVRQRRQGVGNRVAVVYTENLAARGFARYARPQTADGTHPRISRPQ